MSYLVDSLAGGETLEAQFKLHWIHYVSAGLWTVVWLVLAPVTLGLTLLIAVWQWLRLLKLEQGLTSRRLLTKRGIIARKTAEIKLNVVETVEFDQGILGRIFGYGRVRATGRGISDVSIVGVSDPMGVKRRIEEQVETREQT